MVTAGWTFASLGGAPPESAAFWEALAIGSLAAVQALVPLAMFVGERLGRSRRARR